MVPSEEDSGPNSLGDFCDWNMEWFELWCNLHANTRAKLLLYCWWKKSGKPVEVGSWSIPGGAGFLPSTVWYTLSSAASLPILHTKTQVLFKKEKGAKNEPATLTSTESPRHHSLKQTLRLRRSKVGIIGIFQPFHFQLQVTATSVFLHQTADSQLTSFRWPSKWDKKSYHIFISNQLIQLEKGEVISCIIYFTRKYITLISERCQLLPFSSPLTRGWHPIHCDLLSVPQFPVLLAQI